MISYFPFSLEYYKLFVQRKDSFKKEILFSLQYCRRHCHVVEILCVSKYGKGRNISVTCLRYSANHNALDSWPIRANRTFQID